MEREALTQMIAQIRSDHQADFGKLKEPVAVIIHLSDGGSVFYRIDTDGITEQETEPDVENKIIASYSDMMKAKKSKLQLVRFLSTGRIKLRGNITMLMTEIKSLMA